MSAKKALEEVDLISLRPDGRVSIEHQLELHVLDLTDINNSASGVSLEDVLHGIKYVMEYRIKGGKMPNLEADLMKRLLEGLLLNMRRKEGSSGSNSLFSIKQKPSREADMAFTLFGEFIEEVEEFRDAVASKSVVDLAHSLKIHRRCHPWSTQEQKQSAIAILGLLVKYFSHTLAADWKELVKRDEIHNVEQVIKELGAVFEEPSMPETTKQIYVPQALWFEKEVPRVLKMLRTNPETGLSSSIIPKLREHYGTNRLPDPPKPSILKMIWTQLTDFMVLILIAATIVTASLNEEKSSVTLAIVILFNITVGFTQEYKANKALDALVKLSVTQAKVIRDSVTQTISADELVPGDVVILDEGEAVPADLRLIEVSQLQVVESILTGESVPVTKDIEARKVRTRKLPLGDCRGNAFMSTVVARGRGIGVVVRTGDATEIGKISKALTSTKVERTPIERRLGILGKWLVVAAILLSALIVVIGLAWGGETRYIIEIGVSLAVSVIPEGLVAVVTVTMAIGVRNMAQRNAIVRRLPSVETLGSVTYICSDKTGTLTEGKMGTSAVWLCDNTDWTFTESTDLDPNKGQVLRTIEKGKTEPMSTPTPLFTAFMMIASLCNNASVRKEEDGTVKTTGDPTEVALVVASQKAKLPREHFETERGFSKLGEFPFDSERKLMSSIYAPPQSALESDGAVKKVAILAKGAPEAILQRCTHSVAPAVSSETLEHLLQQTSSSATAVTDEFLNLVSNQAAQMASCGLRVLAVAYRMIEEDSAKKMLEEEDESQAEKDLVFVGLVGLMDPPKPGVREAVQTCRTAGIKVVMITGDHINTASAIARDIGIMDPNDPARNRAMKGTELDMLNDEQIRDLRPFPVVFARVSPENKLQIVKALQARGELAAMTGDGVNDAPAIKKSNVGIAMGIGGTEITKQAADIILADDNFTTIVEAVKEGRRVFDNIQKFLVYLLSCNGTEILLFLLCVSVDVPMPFETIMILWANIIADIPPAMSLGVEPPEPTIMERKPRHPKAGVLPLSALFILGSQIIIMTFITFTVYMILIYQKHVFPSITGQYEIESTTFLVLVTMQITQSFWSRSVASSSFRMGLRGNRWLIFAFFLSMGLMLMGFYVEAIANWLEFEPPNGIAWAITAVCLVLQFVFVELAKMVGRKLDEKLSSKLWSSNNPNAIPV